MRFTQQDFEGALDFVRDLYDHRGLEDFADRTMGALLRLVGAERVIYGDFEVERQAARLAMQPAIVKEPDGTVDGVVNGALSGLERSFGQHPLYRYFLQTGDGRPQKATQIMTRTQYRKYCEKDDFARQLGAKFQMGVFFAAGPSVVTAILLTHSDRDFSQRERALMNRLYPHLVQAFRNTASLNRLCRDVDELVEMLEGPTSSVVVLAGTGRVKRWTEQAKTWIAQYCRTPFPAEADRLPDCFAEWYQRQLALAAQETLLPSPRDPLIVDKDARQLTVQFIPDHFRDEHLLLLNEKRRDSSWSTLGAHGLTPRESEVLAWVAKGKTNAEVGAILQMSGRTVQKHLEHIYAKLGVETRTTATVRALKMLGIDSN
ncbi:MAG TPA: helix-turn-helix transcriptional regulator [Burkholderiales bacterium]|nr:helix-turn-helix transcriptional regulator [Burkholderiales bacterium]